MGEWRAVLVNALRIGRACRRRMRVYAVRGDDGWQWFVDWADTTA